LYSLINSNGCLCQIILFIGKQFILVFKSLNQLVPEYLNILKYAIRLALDPQDRVVNITLCTKI
jgi:hypothetical protein